MKPNNDTPSIRFAGFTDLPAGRQALGKWCVYVLECDDGSLYKGKTNDLIRRISEHMKGHGAEHTQKHKPVKLVYFEAFKSEEEALEKEQYLKSGSGREWLKAHLQKYLPLDYSRELEYDHYAWEQRKLEEAVDVCSGCDYKSLSEGSIPVYGTGGYMLSVNKALSYTEDAVGIGRKGTIDKPYILRAPFWTVDTLFYAVPREGYDLQFVLGVFLKIDWKKKDESTGVPSLSKVTINTTEIVVPKVEEQRKIGNLLQSIDRLITLHQRKLERLQNIKKACLEKMFV